ncbi:MAG: 16S rRNA (adenine(1518)-N(6)/adenine(1519)-N(6))-dimethyltransferase RsmA [Prevotella sp.]|nr:16S rRNA (adenine(1518)-N(6)/adenine(1519)-N(6))-dimethyltransferase RsmA [Prevotella sp.]
MEITYKKLLGQNFIYDVNFLQALVKKLDVQPADVVVEVGAGAGTLTQALAETGCQVYSLEIDQRLTTVLKKRLQSYPNVQLIFADAMKYDFNNLPPFRLIANVPYYITTPLIMRFLSLPNCRDLNILVADEVAERIVAQPGNALYGALSVSCQLQAQCQIIQKVPRTMFTPQPKIDSAFVCLKKNGQNYDFALGQLLKGIFAARRKTVLNALAGALSIDKTIATQILTDAEIPLTLRPEQITPTEFAKIGAISRKFC